MEEAVSFRTGGVSLEGLLSLPDRPARTGIVVCHPHPLRGGEMRNNVVEALVRAFMAEGHATLRFNFRGVAGSTGEYDDGEGEQDDVTAAVGYLLSRQVFERVVVAGYSFGSIVGLKAGGNDARVSALIGVALPVARRDASFVSRIDKPTLLISGDCDPFSPIADLRGLLDAMTGPKALEIVSGTDHFFIRREEEVGEAAVTFLRETSSG
ncbi:MAG: alpha/beta hydrolase [Hyphomicrobiaceae bacterium]